MWNLPRLYWFVVASLGVGVWIPYFIWPGDKTDLYLAIGAEVLTLALAIAGLRSIHGWTSKAAIKLVAGLLCSISSFGVIAAFMTRRLENQVPPLIICVLVIGAAGGILVGILTMRSAWRHPR